MNIVDAYIKLKGQLVILVSGITGSGISHLAKNISKDLNIPSLSYASFYKKDYNKKIKLSDGTEVINWDTDDVIDWDALNQSIKEKKGKGVVVYGQSFPIDRLDDIDIDFHIHIKLSKQNLLNRRLNYILKKNESSNRERETLIFNRLTFPYYLHTMESIDATKTKFINANEYSSLPEDEYDEKLANESFHYLMNVIQKWLDKYNQKI